MKPNKGHQILHVQNGANPFYEKKKSQCFQVVHHIKIQEVGNISIP